MPMLPPVLLLALGQFLSSAAGQADGEWWPDVGCHVDDETDLMQVHSNLFSSPKFAAKGHAQGALSGRSAAAVGASAGQLAPEGVRLKEGVGRGLKVLNPWDFLNLASRTRAEVFATTVGQDGTSTGSTHYVTAALVLISVVLVGVVSWCFRPEQQRSNADTELRWYHILILMQLDFIQPFSQDSYLPSLPTMVKDLGSTETMVALSLQVNWFTAGVVCLAMGIGADNFGRRPMVLLGMVCYVIGALGACLAPSVEWLIIGRIMQGVGEGTNVLCYTMARDAIQDESERTKLFAVFAIVATTAVTVAPVVGGAMASWWGWRSVFLLLALWGTTIMLHAMMCLPETRPIPELDDTPVEATPLPEPQREGPMRKFAAIFLQSSELWALFLTLWLLGPLMMGILSNIPYLLDGFGVNSFGIFWTLSMLAFFSLMGSGASLFLLHFLTSRGTLRLAMVALLVTAPFFCAVGTSLLPVMDLKVFIALPGIFIFVQSIMQGPIRSLIAQPFGEAAGTAMGVAQALNGPLAAVGGFGLTRALEAGGAKAWMLGLGIPLLVMQLCYWSLSGGTLKAEVLKAPFEEQTEETTEETDAKASDQEAKPRPKAK